MLLRCHTGTSKIKLFPKEKPRALQKAALPNPWEGVDPYESVRKSPGPIELEAATIASRSTLPEFAIELQQLLFS
jgi:hypothetical protein